MLLGDLGNPNARRLALALNVTPRTAQRWITADDAPRPVLLALFYLTRWGHSAVHAQAESDAQIYRSAWHIAVADAERRTRDVQRLLAVGDFGTANDPIHDIAPLVAGLPSLVSAR